MGTLYEAVVGGEVADLAVQRGGNRRGECVLKTDLGFRVMNANHSICIIAKTKPLE